MKFHPTEPWNLNIWLCLLQIVSLLHLYTPWAKSTAPWGFWVLRLAALDSTAYSTKRSIPIRPFHNIYLACISLGEISHCFIDYLCTLFFHRNGSSIAASPLGALDHHPSHILILWRCDISIWKDIMVIAETVYLAMLFSSEFFHIKYCSSLGCSTQPSRTLMSCWSAPFH